MQLRDQAIENHKASGFESPLPRSLTETPPPRPPPFQEDDFTDVSVDITANGFDASESFTLERSIADEMIPLADPGMERPVVSLAKITEILPAYSVSAGLAYRSRPQQPSAIVVIPYWPPYQAEVGSAHRSGGHEGPAGRFPLLRCHVSWLIPISESSES